ERCLADAGLEIELPGPEILDARKHDIGRAIAQNIGAGTRGALDEHREVIGRGLLETRAKYVIFEKAHGGARNGPDRARYTANEASDDSVLSFFVTGDHLDDGGHGAMEYAALLQSEFLDGAEGVANNLLVEKSRGAPPEDRIVLGGAVVGVGPRNLLVEAVDERVISRALRRI